MKLKGVETPIMFDEFRIDDVEMPIMFSEFCVDDIKTPIHRFGNAIPKI